MKFVKSFFAIIGTHLAMCVLPLLLSPILNTNAKFTVKVPKSAGQIVVYALYFILFFAVYFVIGRVVGGKFPEARKNLNSVLARVAATVIIAAVGLYVYFGVIVPQNLDVGFWSIFAMPQLMVRRAIVDEVVGNKIFSTIAMLMPSLLVWIGYFSNGFKKKK